MKTKSTIAIGCALMLFGATLTALAQETGAPAGTAPAPTSAERIAALKASLAKNQQSLMQYQWLETQVVNYKGEDKSSTQNSCAYGADGKVAKTPVAAPPADDGKRGLRGKIVDDKKADMAAYMHSAVALIKTYIPPDPAKIQTAKDAGNIAMTVPEPGKRVKLDIKNYEKPGDLLSIELDMTTNQILGVTVASYLSDTKDAVTLNVAMAPLADGTEHPATVVLGAPAKEIKVTITNSGYTKKAN